MVVSQEFDTEELGIAAAREAEQLNPPPADGVAHHRCGCDCPDSRVSLRLEPRQSGMTVRQRVTKTTVTSLTYPGIPESVPEVRHMMRAILAHSPRADDIELIAAELVTNAIRHTPSGQEGRAFTITVTQEPGRARLEVADLGTAPWRPAHPNADRMAEHGRGLEIVAALADSAGHGLSDGHNRFSWATLSWLKPDLPGSSAAPPGDLSVAETPLPPVGSFQLDERTAARGQAGPDAGDVGVVRHAVAGDLCDGGLDCFRRAG